jgi:hypothetical protein
MDMKKGKTMTYDEAMVELNEAIYAAVRAADNHDGAPVQALKEIAADIDSIIDHGVTRSVMNDMKALYEGAKRAGLTG